jgi:hypothetical protein
VHRRSANIFLDGGLDAAPPLPCSATGQRDHQAKPRQPLVVRGGVGAESVASGCRADVWRTQWQAQQHDPGLVATCLHFRHEQCGEHECHKLSPDPMLNRKLCSGMCSWTAVGCLEEVTRCMCAFMQSTCSPKPANQSRHGTACHTPLLSV